MNKEFFELRRVSADCVKFVHNIVRDGIVVETREIMDFADAIEKGILPRYVSKHKKKD